MKHPFAVFLFAGLSTIASADDRLLDCDVFGPTISVSNPVTLPLDDQGNAAGPVSSRDGSVTAVISLQRGLSWATIKAEAKDGRPAVTSRAPYPVLGQTFSLTIGSYLIVCLRR
jgi:hypothetical protein